MKHLLFFPKYNNLIFPKDFRISYIKQAFQRDKGQHTNNIHIIALRHILSMLPTDVNIINLVQGTTIMQSEIDSLTSIKPSILKLINSPKEIRSAMRILLGRNRCAGVYIFTNNKNGKQYVGSSINLKARLTTYFNVNYRHNSQLLLNDFQKFQYSDYNLQIFIIPNDFSSMNMEIIRKKTLVLEQYYLFTMNPCLNTIKVAGRPTGINKPVFVYCNNVLIFEALSFSLLSEVTGISVTTLRKTSLLFQKIILTNVRITNCITDLITPNDFRVLINYYKQKSQMEKISRINSVSVNKSSVSVIAKNSVTNEEISSNSLKELSRLLSNHSEHVSYSTIQRYLKKGNIYKTEFLFIINYTPFN